MYLSQGTDQYAFHVITGRRGSYLFDPATLELFRVQPADAQRLSEIESNPRTQFRLAGEPEGYQRFAATEFARPYELSVLLTAACNLQCDYCFARDTYRSKQHLDGTVARRFIGYFLSRNRLKFLKFFGGEPLLRYRLMQDLTEYVERGVQAGKERPAIGLVTNGLLLKPDRIAWLRDHGITVTISCDGVHVSPAVSGQRLPRRRQRDRLIQVMADALEAGLDISVQSTYTRRHVEEGIDPYELMEDLRGVGVRCCHIMPAFGEMQTLTKEQFSWVREGFRHASYESVMSFMGDRPVVLVYVLRILSRLLRFTEGHFICGAGIDSLTLMPSGEVYPCYLLYGPAQRIIDLNTEPVEELGGRLAAVRTEFVAARKSLIPDCAKCWNRTLCASCFGESYMRDQSLGSPSHEFCESLKVSAEGILVALAELQRDPRVWQEFTSRVYKFVLGSGQPVINV